MIGKILRMRYKILKELATGGFGETYLAEDLDIPGTPLCVVKRLIARYNETAKRLFEKEAEILYQLGEHDRIPRLFARFDEDREFYLVQEYIEGHELSQELIEGQPWNEAKVIALLQDILEILVFVHQYKDKDEKAVIHRDINPNNLMRRNKDSKLVLIDFGAVKEVRTKEVDPPGKTQTTVAVGNPYYMPSEQCNGKPKLSSDIYAVGIVGIQALTGEHPINFLRDPKNEIIWRNKVQVSSKLANILDTMVRYDFRERYPSAIEALQAFKGLINSG